MTKQDLIDYAISHICDFIPYDDPDYEKKLMYMAEAYADYELKERYGNDIEDSEGEEIG